MEHYGQIAKGKFCPDSPDTFRADFARYEGKQIFVTVRLADKRTTKQNKYYWLNVVQPITEVLNDLGNSFTTKVMHEILKAKFLKTYEVFNTTGELVERIKSTTELTKQEFSDYCEKCLAWASEFFGMID